MNKAVILPTSSRHGSLVIGILARNCGKQLRKNISSVENLGSRFPDYHVVILENNSTDGTKNVIREWALKNDKVVSIVRDELGGTVTEEKGPELPYPKVSNKRIGRMARCRNILLEEIRARFTPDIVCMVDIDLFGFDVDGVMSAIQNAPDGWGALLANGSEMCHWFTGKRPFPHQYDIYAYLPYKADFHDTRHCLYKGVDQRRESVRLNRIIIDSSSSYIPVGSAFGGVGIYKFECLEALEYEACSLPELSALSISLCEHVPFHCAIAAKGYGIYIAREMRTYRKEFSFLHTLSYLLKYRKATGECLKL